MKRAEECIYLDHHRPKMNGTCSVKIRITHNRKRKYYSTGIDLSIEEFDKVLNGKRKTNDQKEIEDTLNYLKSKARDVIRKLPVFTFGAFEEMFLSQQNTFNSVTLAFDKYIKELKLENRIGTAVSYNCAKNSIESFKKDLTFAEITPDFLRRYEKFMLSENKSIFDCRDLFKKPEGSL